MALLMGIDLGTSSLKTIIIDESGNVKAQCSRGYQFDSPYTGYAEQEPDVWWKACCTTVKEAISVCGTADIAGVSFSGQMHGLVMLDKDYKSVRPAILHCDARSAEQVEALREIFGQQGIRELMMNAVYTGFLLPSLLWVRENEPQNFKRIRYVCLPKDYLKLKMTGEISTDYSDASATLAFDIKNLCWSDRILCRLQINPDIFPACFETTADTGRVCGGAAMQTGLSTHTVVAAGGGDQVMQGIGNGVVDASVATVNIGSSGQVCFQADRPILNPSLSTNMFCGYQKGRWILFGATMTAGWSLGWWNRVCGNDDYERMNREVSAIPPGSGGVIFLPYLNGERTPHLDPNLSGVFMGANISTTRAHMTRAVMEGVAYSLMQCIEVCGGLGFSAKSLVASGGGARSRPWLQLQADIYNLPLNIAQTQEQAGLGAAIAAGVGAGVFDNLDQGCWAAIRYKDEAVLPNEKNHCIYREYYALYKEIQNVGKGILQKVTILGRR